MAKEFHMDLMTALYLIILNLMIHQSSWICRKFIYSGLTPEELFFHAMGGRVGLIDTAVKTSQTGYIQRRIIKGCGRFKVEYDMTARNNKGKITQYVYGDDNFDPCKVEGYSLTFLNLDINGIYKHYDIPHKNTPDSDMPILKKYSLSHFFVASRKKKIIS